MLDKFKTVEEMKEEMFAESSNFEEAVIRSLMEIVAALRGIEASLDSYLPK